MIQQQTILSVCDNSGAKTVKCIKVLGGFKKRYAQTGDVIVVSIQTIKGKLKENIKVKKGEVYRGLVVKVKKKEIKKVHEFFQYEENSVILLNNQNLPVGTRITCFLPRVLKKKKFQKIISISYGLQ
jgi:large subunit ribosomal protein L14